MTDDRILDAEEFQALCLQDAILATDHYEALRGLLHATQTERDAARVEFNAWEEERDRADAEEARAEVAEALLAEVREHARLNEQAAATEVARLQAELDLVQDEERNSYIIGLRTTAWEAGVRADTAEKRLEAYKMMRRVDAERADNEHRMREVTHDEMLRERARADERADWHPAEYCHPLDKCPNEDRADVAEARVAALTQALRDHGHHRLACQVTQALSQTCPVPWEPNDEALCDCGLARAVLADGGTENDT